MVNEDTNAGLGTDPETPAPAETPSEPTSEPAPTEGDGGAGGDAGDCEKSA